VWLISAKGGTAHRLTHGPWSCFEGAAPFTGSPSDPSWSPDGKTITFARQTNADDADTDLTQIMAVDVATGSTRLLTDATTYEYEPSFSPGGGMIAYERPHGPTPLSVMDVYVTSLHQENRDLAHDLDRDVAAFAWVPDSQDLVMLGPEGPRGRIWRTDAAGQIHRLPSGDLSVDQFAVGIDGLVAFVGSTPSTPPEVYVLNPGAARPRQLTHLNDAMLRFKYGQSFEMTWTSPDGEKCDGILTYPVGVQVGKKYPLVIWSHGGPEAYAPLAYIGFEAQELRQTLAADGFIVFEPNYRGSDNLGNQHEHAIYQDPGDGPFTDLMAGLAALESLGMVDESRIAIAGHSYGGLMTGWAIGHDHRWRCAVVADGAVDWKDTFNLSAAGNLAWARDSLGGTPWDQGAADLYRSGSPISYADQIVTPTLIISGTADETVPISESFQLYHALHERHIPVKFIGIPGAQHTPDDPVRLERFNEVMESWILEH